jgi:hypothetical protein
VISTEPHRNHVAIEAVALKSTLLLFKWTGMCMKLYLHYLPQQQYHFLMPACDDCVPSALLAKPPEDWLTNSD